MAGDEEESKTGGAEGVEDDTAPKMKELHMRERAIARAEDLQETKVEGKMRDRSGLTELHFNETIQQAVNKKLDELEISNGRLNSAAKIFKKICGHYPAAIGKAVSKKERQDDALEEQSLVYGEIQFRTFALALEKIRHKYGGLSEPGGIFVDVGSGSGKPVFAAMLMHEFDRVIGIEILTGLHELSRDMEAIWHERKHKIGGITEKMSKTQIEFIRGDIFNVDWSDATLAFVNSTCFDDEMMNRLVEPADKMKPGSFFISFTRRIPSENWQVLEYERHLMSWGDATVFIHQRKADLQT
ncbi:Histone-lysine N-methyltransferase, H3 lysine-79 specific [Hondaea fermentalgiana]|uniref:Histone-lysine N-methyltransferase, H3 lysine-79 specific n=1 Tax=Hondaea fermentalgiana TaxID=2315210 RepID=A0A2R5GI67_9STRA|nr:Histone-lysine N-methyltransferase, H3 lysine-79 specific [Hondaea fermentalgiana]|eukprot:GBG30582.1 Histone-lysine N-methyltransferase, H3 lysine-79 specific [Hondaea fermentalgiana]